jgi:hypothetical protein
MGFTQGSADIIDDGGIQRLATDSIVTVESLFGKDPQASTFFYINTQYDVGSIAINDTVRVQIAVGENATLFPAVDVTTTVTSTETGAANPETALANLIVTNLNNNANFSLNWKASRIKDFSGVFINAKLFNEWGERPNTNSFQVTTTGTTTVNLGFNNIIRRGFETELNRSPNNPRLGVLAISGTVFAVPGGAGDLLIDNAKNAGSSNLRVNGSLATPIIFSISADATETIFITELRFYGGATSLKFEQFLGQNNALTNGIKIEIKSDNQMITLPLIKSTEDFKNKFSFGGADNFSIDIQAGADQFVASFLPSFSLGIKRQGSFGAGNDDYIKVYIQDNLTSGMSELEFIVLGFKREE